MANERWGLTGENPPQITLFIRAPTLLLAKEKLIERGTFELLLGVGFC